MTGTSETVDTAFIYALPPLESLATINKVRRYGAVNPGDEAYLMEASSFRPDAQRAWNEIPKDDRPRGAAARDKWILDHCFEALNMKILAGLPPRTHMEAAAMADPVHAVAAMAGAFDADNPPLTPEQEDAMMEEAEEDNRHEDEVIAAIMRTALSAAMGALTDLFPHRLSAWYTAQATALEWFRHNEPGQRWARAGRPADIDIDDIPFDQPATPARASESTMHALDVLADAELRERRLEEKKARRFES